MPPEAKRRHRRAKSPPLEQNPTSRDGTMYDPSEMISKCNDTPECTKHFPRVVNEIARAFKLLA